MIDDPDWNPIEHGFVPIAEDLETTARLTFESIARIYSGQAEVQSLLELLRFRSNDRTQPTRAFGNGRFVDTSICRFDAVRQYLMLNGYGQVAVEVENKMNQLMTSFKSLDETLTAKLTRQNTTAETVADVAKDRAFKSLFDEACSEASELAKLLRSISDRVRWNVAANASKDQRISLTKFAKLCGKDRSQPTRWRKRFTDFPQGSTISLEEAKDFALRHSLFAADHPSTWT